MAYMGNFSTMQPSAAEMAAAIEKINIFTKNKNMSKKIINDILIGFRALEQALQRHETEAYDMVLKWLRLYLDIEATINPKDERLRQHFEKTVPAVVSYVIGCLQHKAKHIPSYHYQLLEMLHELLSNVHPAVIEKLANFESGIIACLWFPIDFVGDFNTQMMALRLLVMLLKCVDDARQQHELDKIRCSQTHVLRNKLITAVKVANYHAAKFENTARELLNSYNMNMAMNILVYSFRCKTVRLDNKIEFFKAANVEDFWVDLNYCPRTLTYNGRYKAKSRSRYINCSVTLQILQIKLNETTLHVHFCAPAEFSKELKAYKELLTTTDAQIELPRDEALRLQENHFIFSYYNNQQIPQQVNHMSLESDISLEHEELNLETQIDNISNKENIEPNHAKNACIKSVAKPPQTNATSTTTVLASIPQPNNFQKSYDILVGDSNESDIETTTQHTNITSTCLDTDRHFKLPSLPNYENVVSKTKTDGCNKPLSATQTITQDVISDSPKTSRKNTGCKNEHNQETHPIRQLREKRRFFKTPLLSSDSEASQRALHKAPNLIKPRTRKRKASNDAHLKRKKINKVKPMSRSLQSNVIASEHSNAAAEVSDPAAIINITNFLDSGNESTAVFSDAQRRTILENVQRICVNSTNNANLGNQNDIYENRNVSDAEAGQSYRNFTVRRPAISQPVDSKKVKRQRKSAHLNEKELCCTSRSVATAPASMVNVSAVAKRTRKRTNAQSISAIDGIKHDDALASSATCKMVRLANINDAPIHKNQTLYSTDIEIDLTCSPQSLKVAETLHTDNTSNKEKLKIKQTKVLGQKDTQSDIPVKNSCKKSSMYNESIKNAECDSAAFSQSVTHNQFNGLPTLANNKAATAPLSDVEHCRHDMTAIPTELSPLCDLNIVTNEFSDSNSPMAPTMMNISDIAFSSDNEPEHNSPKRNRNIGDTLEKQHSKSEIIQISRNKKKPQECILYRRRSECDSDSEHSDIGNETNDQEMFHPYPSTELQTPDRDALENRSTTISNYQVTTTATSIITRQERLFSQEVIVNVAVSPKATANAPALSAVVERTNASKLTLTNSRFLEAEACTRNALTSLSNATWQDIAETPKILKQESSNMIAEYKRSISSEMDKIREHTKDNQTDAYIKKVCDISERIVDEMNKERKELQALEKNIERIVRQLDWQYETYQRKTEQFQCFKQNIEGLLQVLTSIDIKKNIESEALYIIEKLQSSAKHMSAKQWRDFVNTSTENLLRNISSLSDL